MFLHAYRLHFTMVQYAFINFECLTLSFYYIYVQNPHVLTKTSLQLLGTE